MPIDALSVLCDLLAIAKFLFLTATNGWASE